MATGMPVAAGAKVLAGKYFATTNMLLPAYYLDALVGRVGQSAADFLRKEANVLRQHGWRMVQVYGTAGNCISDFGSGDSHTPLGKATCAVAKGDLSLNHHRVSVEGDIGVFRTPETLQGEDFTLIQGVPAGGAFLPAAIAEIKQHRPVLVANLPYAGPNTVPDEEHLAPPDNVPVNGG